MLLGLAVSLVARFLPGILGIWLLLFWKKQAIGEVRFFLLTNRFFMLFLLYFVTFSNLTKKVRKNIVKKQKNHKKK
jgi:hypothetical protein